MSEGPRRLRISVPVIEATYSLDPVSTPTEATRIAHVRPLPADPATRAAGLRRYEATVDGWTFEVTVEDEARAVLRERAGQAVAYAGQHGSDVVHAQIPGRVARLWVAEGDTVEAGQRLLAIEAMKMENEVRAPRAGIVGAIRVGPGSSVELRDELLTVTSARG
jgi:biotin carboxyl carrier protein